MAWNEAVITDAGIALLARTFTEGNILLTGAMGGEGYTEGSSLMSLTEIEPPVHELGLAGIVTEKGKMTVKVHGQNTGVETRYTLRLIGIFAREKGAGGGDVLFAVIQDRTGELIPAAAENPEFLLEFDFVIPLSNAENIEVVISSSLFALQVGVERMARRVDIAISRENWNVQTDGTLYTDVPLKEITADLTPFLTVLPDSLPAAKSCGMSTVCQTLEGRLRVFAQKNPAADIHGSLLLVREYGGDI